jgi:hypothetical protein
VTLNIRTAVVQARRRNARGILHASNHCMKPKECVMAITPAGLQQLSSNVIQLYRDLARLATTIPATDDTKENLVSAEDGAKEYPATALGANAGEIPRVTLNRLLKLCHSVLLQQEDFIWFRRAHVQQPLNGWRATCRASWHDQAAFEAGTELWGVLGSDAPRFPPQSGDPVPELLQGYEEGVAISSPDIQWEGYHTWSDENDGWEAKAMEVTLRAEAARAFEICVAECAPVQQPIELAAEFIGSLDPELSKILQIASSGQSADDRMRAIYEIDSRCLAFDSTKWGTILGVSSGMVRKTTWWKKDRANHINKADS